MLTVNFSLAMLTQKLEIAQMRLREGGILTPSSLSSGCRIGKAGSSEVAESVIIN